LAPDAFDEAQATEQRIDASSAAAWEVAIDAARTLASEVDPGFPDVAELRNIAARIELGALVMASVEMRRTHHELKADIFELSMAEHRRNDRLFGAIERIAEAFDSLEQRLQRIENTVGKLVAAQTRHG
jgi:hypothetical protein